MHRFRDEKWYPAAVAIVIGVVVFVLLNHFGGIIAWFGKIIGYFSPVILGIILVLVGFSRLMRWVEAHPEKDWLVVCIGLGLAAAVAVYAAVKPYPADYDAAGKLIVDGAKMANDTFKGVGWSAAFLIGWILERRFVGFATDIPLARKLTRAAGGLLGYYAFSLILVPLVKSWIPGPAGTIVSCFIQMFFVSFLFPWCFHCLEKAGAQPEAAPARAAD